MFSLEKLKVYDRALASAANLDRRDVGGSRPTGLALVERWLSWYGD
jgi:hypothetical protein